LILIVVLGVAFAAGYLLGVVPRTSARANRSVGTTAAAVPQTTTAKPAPRAPSSPPAAGAGSANTTTAHSPPVSPPATKPAASGPPKIVFDQPDYDFGAVEQGGKIHHVFAFANRGGATLVIEKVETSCGCTAALASAKEIPAGGRGEVSAEFSSSGFRGQVRKEVYVYSNDPATPKATLNITGTVQVLIEVSPLSIYYTGATTSQELTQTVTVAPAAGHPEVHFRVLGVSCPDRRVHISAVRAVPDRDSAYQFDVSAGPGLPVGRLNANITVTTDFPKQPTLSLQVYANVK
jgi:hypothetical protein